MSRTPPTGESGDLFSRPAPRPLSVSELTRALRNAIEPRFRDVWVAGEIANLRRQVSGHLYFSLKDAEAVIAAVIWSSKARSAIGERSNSSTSCAGCGRTRRFPTKVNSTRSTRASSC